MTIRVSRHLLLGLSLLGSHLAASREDFLVTAPGWPRNTPPARSRQQQQGMQLPARGWPSSPRRCMHACNPAHLSHAHCCHPTPDEDYEEEDE